MLKHLNARNIIRQLPDIATLGSTVSQGQLAGRTVQVRWNGEWLMPGGAVLFRDFPRGDLELVASPGTLVIRRPSPTSSSGGEIRGVSLGVELRTSSAASVTGRLFRTYVKTCHDLGSLIHFPDHIQDDRYSATALLPLTVEGEAVDVYFLKQGPFLIIESSAPGLTVEKFGHISATVRRLLEYLTGVDLATDSCTIVLDEAGTLLRASWRGGREPRSTSYRPIPCSWPELGTAQKQLSYQGHALDGAVLSRCLANCLRDDGWVTPFAYIKRFPQAPLEMRGAFLSVALESLTYHLKKIGSVSFDKPVADEAWPAVRDRLLAVVEEHDLPSDATAILQQRIQNINGPTNRAKLLKPFQSFGIALSPAEQNAIDKRNTLLHRGRLFDPEVLDATKDAWHKPYMVEMRLYTAINKLLLSYIGYEGPIIDWGETPVDRPEQTYVMLAPAEGLQ